MTINLIGVHPFTYEGQVKKELSARFYPVAVRIEWDDNAYMVVSPKEYYAHVAWYLTDNPEINKWIDKYWERTSEQMYTEDES